MLKVAVTGGIGSGKSTVCRLFAELGVPIYDSDREAKRLMSSSAELGVGIRALLGDQAYREGELDRAFVASRVFVDGELLKRLNSLVHPAVRNDFASWTEGHRADGASYVIMESALVFESDLYQLFDVTITISAPVELRVERVAKRDGVDRQVVWSRVQRQRDDASREAMADYVVSNGEGELLLPQVLKLDKILRKIDKKQCGYEEQNE